MIGAASGAGRGPATCFWADAATFRTGADAVVSFAAGFGCTLAAARCGAAVFRCLRLEGTVPLMPTEASTWKIKMHAAQRVTGDWIDLFIPVRYSPIGEFVEELYGQSSTTTLRPEQPTI